MVAIIVLVAPQSTLSDQATYVTPLSSNVVISNVIPPGLSSLPSFLTTLTGSHQSEALIGFPPSFSSITRAWTCQPSLTPAAKKIYSFRPTSCSSGAQRQ